MTVPPFRIFRLLKGKFGFRVADINDIHDKKKKNFIDKKRKIFLF